jgi:hypothetical protein
MNVSLPAITMLCNCMDIVETLQNTIEASGE